MSVNERDYSLSSLIFYSVDGRGGRGKWEEDAEWKADENGMKRGM